MTAKARQLLPLVVGLLLAALAQSAGAATLVGDYRLQRDYTSLASGAPDLTDLGTGNTFEAANVNGFERYALAFPKGAGLRVATTKLLIDNTAHSVVMLFRLADVDGYRRIIETKNGGTDSGLYVKDGKLVFYGRTGAATHADFSGADSVVAPNQWVEVAYAVGYDTGTAGNLVTGYVNGVLQFSDAPDPFNDLLLPGGGGGGLSFFQDNLAGGGLGEDSGGAVTCIRLYNGTLTPAEVTEAYNDPACPTKPPQGRAAVSGRAKAQTNRKSILVDTGVTVSCPAGAVLACSATGALDRAGGKNGRASASVLKRFGRISFSLLAGNSRRVKVKLRGKAARKMRRAGALRMKITVTATASGGVPATVARTLRVKAP